MQTASSQLSQKRRNNLPAPVITSKMTCCTVVTVIRRSNAASIILAERYGSLAVSARVHPGGMMPSGKRGKIRIDAYALRIYAPREYGIAALQIVVSIQRRKPPNLPSAGDMRNTGKKWSVKTAACCCGATRATERHLQRRVSPII